MCRVFHMSYRFIPRWVLVYEAFTAIGVRSGWAVRLSAPSILPVHSILYVYFIHSVCFPFWKVNLKCIEKRQTTFAGVQADRPGIEEIHQVVNRRGIGRRRHISLVGSQSTVQPVSLSASVSELWSMIVMKEDRRQANVEEEETVSTKTGDLEPITSALEPVLTQKSLSRKLPTPLPNVVHPASTRSLKVHSNLSVEENPRHDQFRVKK